VDDRVACDAQFGGQLPRRRQARARLQLVAQDAFLQHAVQAPMVGLAARLCAVEAALQIVDQHAGAVSWGMVGHGARWNQSGSKRKT
jgi:hypothetical protein